MNQIKIGRFIAECRKKANLTQMQLAEKLGCPVHVYEALGHAAYEEAKDFNERVYVFLRE